MTVALGIAEFPPGLDKAAYFRTFPYAEISLGHDRPINPTTWAKLSQHTKGRLGLTAPAAVTHGASHKTAASWPVPKDSGVPRGSLGLLQDSPLAREIIRNFAATAKTMQAQTVSFVTPAEFSPSQTYRDRLLAFFKNVATEELFGDIVRVWRPNGLWEPQHTVKMASDAGVVASIDPLNVPPGEHVEAFADLDVDSVYFRTQGVGGAGRLRAGNHELFVDIASSFDRAWLVFATGAPLRDAMRAQEYVNTLDDSAIDDDADDGDEGDEDENDE